MKQNVHEKALSVPTKKARCYMVHAFAPVGVSARDANNAINALSGDTALPLALWHDHFIGKPGGAVVFYVETPEQQQALFNNAHLSGWDVSYMPLTFSYSPSAFDAQTQFTLEHYRGQDWSSLRQAERPGYGRNPSLEAETGEEQ
ncbi:hypothetical protein [Deinococcus peraridilitoris]|uniref:Uncharacterized protein n=1 Tax=Deinococcus peraridilitoris (strain DSM 19664 / LMG 22246 / CIP 109416 / KR-200) TaxID=937777 RepID=L0A0A8_DEIPD|nr:hypothetical protein [Deinococcus peraridilitoris]AFZ66450.1 hypothetical protein Deipe_0879 [Deinococcus peraridilitoris DSM 19664]